MMSLNIIIPIGGVGTRFSKEGYTRQKPCTIVRGKMMIEWVLDSIKGEGHCIYITYSSDLQKYRFEDTIRKLYPKLDINFIKLTGPTLGASHTLLLTLEYIEKYFTKRINNRVVSMDCDTYYKFPSEVSGNDTCDIISKIEETKGNVICYFSDTNTNPIYSYIKINTNNLITEIKEKEKISDNANTGCYIFESGSLLMKYCKYFVNSHTDTSELYISMIYKEMIRDDIEVRGLKIDSFTCIGTPIQVKTFGSNIIENEIPRRFCFDLDNTLVTFPKISNDYTTVSPINSTINLVKKLKSLGHIIIIHTARKMKTYGGNVGKVVKNIAKITIDTLDKFEIPYDELYFGKPEADFYIDDKAVCAYDDLEKELGFYMSDTSERKFNRIEKKGDKITKYGQVEGEIYYYQNIPESIKYLFPKFYGSSKNLREYTMENIEGITFSYLYRDGSLTPKMLRGMLDKLGEIHEVKLENLPLVNIYQNYIPKIKERYAKFVNKYKDSDKIYNGLIESFKNYKNGKKSVIHGDPVFTNIIMSKEIRFIDVRGKLGDDLSIYGDRLYDYGKIYQSLIGYDHILHDVEFKDLDYKILMIDEFKKYTSEKGINFKDIELITNSLLFTLIPLHEGENLEKARKYYDLITIH